MSDVPDFSMKSSAVKSNVSSCGSVGGVYFKHASPGLSTGLPSEARVRWCIVRSGVEKEMRVIAKKLNVLCMGATD